MDRRSRKVRSDSYIVKFRLKLRLFHANFPSAQFRVIELINKYVVTIMCGTISRSRFDLYFEKEKETIYDLDGGEKLVALYKALGPTFEAELKDNDIAGINLWIGFAFDRGNGYIAEVKLPYESREHPFERAHNLTIGPPSDTPVAVQKSKFLQPMKNRPRRGMIHSPDSWQGFSGVRRHKVYAVRGAPARNGEYRQHVRSVIDPTDAIRRTPAPGPYLDYGPVRPQVLTKD